MLTDIAGNLTKEEMERAFEETKARFNGFVGGNLNSKPIRYVVEVSSNKTYTYPSRHGNYITLYDRSEKNCIDYFSEGKRKEYRRGWDCKMHRDMAFLFPQHKIAMILSFLFNEYYENGIEKLKEMGYTIIERRHNSKTWGNENKKDILKTMRDPNLETKAVDQRASDILDILTSNLSEEPSTYTFNVFNYTFKNATNKYGMRKINEEDFLKQALKPDIAIVQSPAGWRNNKLEDMSKGMPLTRAIGLVSRVETKNGTKYIPMIDFKTKSEWDVKHTLKQVGIPGMVVDSGNSFHFYGFDLLDTEAQWKHYIESLAGKPGVDEWWIKFQLARGYSVLRLTPCKKKLLQPCYVETFTPTGTGTDEYTKSESRSKPSGILIAA